VSDRHTLASRKILAGDRLISPAGTSYTVKVKLPYSGGIKVYLESDKGHVRRESAAHIRENWKRAL